MKFLHLMQPYAQYLRGFYALRPELLDAPFQEQKQALSHDAFSWTGLFEHYLPPLGYECHEILANATPLQSAWAREHGLPESTSAHDIVVAQVRQYQPEVLLFNDYDGVLLKKILHAAPSIKLVLGHAGSSGFPDPAIWRDMDVLLSCAPEMVAAINAQGHGCHLLRHGFDPRVNDRLPPGKQRWQLSFIGHLVPRKDFHLHREALLSTLANSRLHLDIFSPSLPPSASQRMAMIRDAWQHLLGSRRRHHFPERPLRTIIKHLWRLIFPSRSPLPGLGASAGLHAAIFGLDMYQTLRDSYATLNIHADSSPRFASNMHLFEATGVGACLVTDWKENIREFFEPDSEVITYRSPEECMEKISWLAGHPAERDAIALAGQRRALRDHHFGHRAVDLDRIIRSKL